MPMNEPKSIYFYSASCCYYFRLLLSDYLKNERNNRDEILNRQRMGNHPGEKRAVNVYFQIYLQKKFCFFNDVKIFPFI